MHIRDLQLSDAADLLEFELRNRDWFEQFVSPRGERFYSFVAVQDHIRAYLIAKSQGRFHGCLVLDDDNRIIARANLREINIRRGSAEVGYRVDKDSLGRGAASAATRHLIRLAYHDWQLKQLRGFVSLDNAASARVLQKNGFVQVGVHARMAVLKHGKFDCAEYLHDPNLYQNVGP